MRKKGSRDPRCDALEERVAALEGSMDVYDGNFAAIGEAMNAMHADVKAMSDLFVGMLRNFTDFALENELERRATFAVEPAGPEEGAVEPVGE